MPIAAIPTDELNQRLPRELSTEQLELYLEQLGCDIEGFTQVRRIQCQNCSNLHELTLQEELPGKCPECFTEREASELWKDLGEIDVVRMDLLPVRPDIFDAGGLGRAIRGLMDEEIGLPSYEIADPSMTVTVDSSVNKEDSYRPYIACAVVRGLQIDDVSLRVIMKLQENLHWALGRDRKLASIGVYDMSTVEGPIRYTTVPHDGLTFVPLQPQEDKPQTPGEVLETHPKGQGYKHLLEGFSRLPLLIDSKDQVLSMPPIINSHETRVTTKTTDVFIDVTGISDRVVIKTLHILVTSLLELFEGTSLERVTMKYDDREELTPSMETERFPFDVASAIRLIGIDIDRERAGQLLQQMRHQTEVDEDNPEQLWVTVAAYRNDIMHEVDLVEDLAMAYNYLNLIPELVPTMTVAQPRAERVLANRTRSVMNGLGFFETMSLILSNAEEQYDLMRLEDPGDSVKVSNPASTEQTMLRTMIMPQLLRLFALNRGQGLPQKLFEVDDVVKLVEGQEHPVEEMHISGGILDSVVGFADIKAVVVSLAHEVGMNITLEALEHPSMIPGRAASILFDGKVVGMLGEIHPEILSHLRLSQPLVAFELDLSPILPEDWNASLM